MEHEKNFVYNSIIIPDKRAVHLFNTCKRAVTVLQNTLMS